MNFYVIAHTSSGNLEVAQFLFKSDAMAYIRAVNMPIGYHSIKECTCKESFMSKAECRIHGISEQLNRTQSE